MASRRLLPPPMAKTERPQGGPHATARVMCQVPKMWLFFVNKTCLPKHACAGTLKLTLKPFQLHQGERIVFLPFQLLALTSCHSHFEFCRPPEAMYCPISLGKLAKVILRHTKRSLSLDYLGLNFPHVKNVAVTFVPPTLHDLFCIFSGKPNFFETVGTKRKFSAT